MNSLILRGGYSPNYEIKLQLHGQVNNPYIINIDKDYKTSSNIIVNDPYKDYNLVFKIGDSKYYWGLCLVPMGSIGTFGEVIKNTANVSRIMAYKYTAYTEIYFYSNRIGNTRFSNSLVTCDSSKWIDDGKSMHYNSTLYNLMKQVGTVVMCNVNPI